MILKPQVRFTYVCRVCSLMDHLSRPQHLDGLCWSVFRWYM